MIRVLLCSLFLWNIFLASSSSAQDQVKKNVAIIPFEAIDVPASDAEALTREITLGFSSVPEVQTTPFDKVLLTFRDESVIKDSTCRNRVCFLAVGKKLQSEIIFTGTLYKIDKRFSFSLVAIDCRDNTTLWSKDYSCECEYKDFLKKTSNAAVIDSRYALFLGEKNTGSLSEETQKENNSTAVSVTVADSTKSEGYAEDEKKSDDNDDDADDDRQVTTGTVEGLTLGFNGRYVIGGVGNEESEWSAEAMVLYPTTNHSHVRIRFSLPSSTSENMHKNSNFNTNNDLLYSIDHEWGFRKFGISIGAAYMFMDGFSKTIGDYTYNFDEFNLFSWVLGIRAGTPNHGFRGRVCYPMPFALNYGKSEQNTFVEYSAVGMFGGDNVKAGVGIQGVYKRRFSDGESRILSYDYDYYSTDKESVKEFYFMAPCAKVSFLAGTHSVVTLGLDLMGLMTPDIFNSGDGWTPSVYVGYTFSFAPLRKVDSFDGKF
jgi:hypothetical protein